MLRLFRYRAQGRFNRAGFRYFVGRIAKWWNKATGQTEGDPWYDSNQCPPSMNKGFLVLGQDCWGAHLIGAFPTWLSFILLLSYKAYKDLQLSYLLQESWLFSVLFLFLRSVCILISVVSAAQIFRKAWVTFWWMSLFVFYIYFFSVWLFLDFFIFFFFFVLLEVQPFPILLRGQGCLCHLPHLILDTGEEVVKNIFFCMTEHCCTQSIWYFKHTKFDYPDSHYSI